MKGPTKDYRPFGGKYGGRGYRVLRLTLNTSVQLLKRRSSIVLIVLSSLFVFINVIALAIVPQDISYDDIEQTSKFAYFELRPEGPDDLFRMVDRGSTLELDYILTNKGTKTGEAYLALATPSDRWEWEVNGNQLMDVEAGRWSKVTFKVTVPSDQQGFDEVRDELKEYEGRPGIYTKREGEQFITAVAAPTEAIEEMYDKYQEEGAIPRDDISSFTDPRMGTASSLLVLSTREKVVSRDPLLTEQVPVSPSVLRFVDDDGPTFIRTMDVKQNAYIDRSFKLQNTGDSEGNVHVSLYYSPLQYAPFYIELYEGAQERLGPGATGQWRMAISTGYFYLNKAANLLIVAYDGSGPSNVTMLELSYHTRQKSENEKLGRQYYDMLWGGGIRYERYLWLVLFMAISGAALISDDIKNNSMALYLSRPISWAEYIAGKSAGLLIALTPISILPAVLLYITGIAFSNRDLGEAFDTLWLLGSIVLSYLITLILMVSISVALSSVSKKWIYAGVGTFSIFIFSSIISSILRAIFDQDWLKLIDMRTLMKLLYRPLFALPYDASDIGFEWYVTALVMVLIIALCFATVIFRFQNREVAR